MLDVLVVGGGVAGLTLAVACARKGFRVEVFEKDPGPSFRRQGFNLVLSDRSAQLLEESCGLRDLRTKYDWCCDVDPWGWLPVTTRLKDVPILSRFLRGFGAVNRGQFRENLLQLCEKAGVRVVYGHTLEALQESEAEGMVACYFDAPSGATRTARIVAGCDGIHSKTRRLTSPTLELHECGSVCIRGAARDDGSLHRLAKAAPHESMLLFVSCCPGTGFNATVYDGRITWVLEIPTRRLDNGVRGAIARSCGHWHPTLVRLMLVMTPSESLYTETLQDLGSSSGCSGAGRVTLLGDAAHPVTWTAMRRNSKLPRSPAPSSFGTIEQYSPAKPSQHPIAIARPLPSSWPSPLLPIARQVELLPIRCADVSLDAIEAAEDEARLAALLPPSPAKKAKSVCSCGKVDESKFMLACDECDCWFHGECVGVTQEEADALGKWACKTCAPTRQRRLWTCRCGQHWDEDDSRLMVACDECDRWFHGECVGVSEAQAASWSERTRWRCGPCSTREQKRRKIITTRCQRYCVCRGYWDGHSFMIMCDGCQVWYHGNCVGLSCRTETESAQAAFRKWECPTCLPAHRMELEQKQAEGSSSSPSYSLQRSGREVNSPLVEDSPRGVPRRSNQCGAASGEEGETSLMLIMLTDDCIASILSHLQLPSLLLCAHPVSRRFAAVTERAFQVECTSRGWRPPRRAQGQAFIWRHLLRTRSCAVCLCAEANFAVRRENGKGACKFRLCRECARRSKVQQQVALHGLEVDSLGVDGKALFKRQFYMPLFGHADGFDSRQVQHRSDTLGL
ncbi:hypothetical protein AB1Y20_008968 [Prymnesium parvum]|uniref:PHD-type domain-containing protein n=1 Tax=Prymnesium parvum TaxID=97485 RepID=A0AB34K3Q0_PRYPA